MACFETLASRPCCSNPKRSLSGHNANDSASTLSTQDDFLDTQGDEREGLLTGSVCNKDTQTTIPFYAVGVALLGALGFMAVATFWFAQPLEELQGRPLVTFVTVETRDTPMLVRVSNATGGAQSATQDSVTLAHVINLGENVEWDGPRTKVEVLAWFLRNPSESKTALDDEDLVVFVDGADVIWGGCDPAEFIGTYWDIREASGAPIIFGSEFNCCEQDCNKVPQVPAWALRLAGSRKLNGSFWSPYVDGCNRSWDDSCAVRRNCGEPFAMCSVPPVSKFLNAGFFMGPVGELRTMMEWCLSHYNTLYVWGDQSVFAMYWLTHPTMVALDYQGELVLSLAELRSDVLVPDPATGLVENTAFQWTQCLIHGNARGSDRLQELVRTLTNRSIRKATSQVHRMQGLPGGR